MRCLQMLVVCLCVLHALPLAAQTTPEAPQNQPPKTEHKQLTFLAVSNLKGKYAQPMCRTPEKIVHDWPKIVAFQKALSADKPITINMGDAYYPGALGRYFLQRGQQGAKTLVSLLTLLKFDVHTLGHHDFDPLFGQLNAVINALEIAKQHLKSVNIQCNSTPGREQLCDVLGTSKQAKTPSYRIVKRQGLRVALIPYLDPAVKKIIDPNHLKGIDILDPETVLPPLFKSIVDKDKADFIVLLPHLRNTASLLKLYRFLEKHPQVNLAITNIHPGEEEDEKTYKAGYIKVGQSRTYITYSGQSIDHLAHIKLELQQRHKRWSIHTLSNNYNTLDKQQPDANALAQITAAQSQFCKQWGQPIAPKRKLSKPLTRSDFQQTVLNLLQVGTKTEVAILNDRAFRNERIYPLTTTLTYEDIYTALPFSNGVMLATITGKNLKTILPLIDAGKLISAGLTKKAGNWLVNGRPIDDGRRYSIALNDYLAGGGDGFFTKTILQNPKRFRQSWSKQQDVTLNNLIIHQLKSDTLDEHLNTKTLSPSAFVSLHHNLLWRFLGSVTLNYQQINVDNPGYDAAQLSNASTAQFNSTLKLQALADSRNHRLGNTLTLNFAMLRQDDGDENTEDLFEETQDILQLVSHYDYTRWRQNIAKAWVPSPFIEAQLQTEIDAPEDRTWRQFELTGIIGAKWQLTDQLSIQTGADVRSELGDPNGRISYGLHIGYQWNRTTMFNLFDAPLQFETNLNYFYNDIGQLNTQELRNSNKLYYALLEHVFLTVSADIFGNRNDTIGQWGTNVDLKFGINALWDGTIQTF